jgi:hypothetical protein
MFSLAKYQEKNFKLLYLLRTNGDPHFSFYINVYLPIFNIMAKLKKKFNVGSFLFFRFSVYAVQIVHDRQCFLIKLVPNIMRIISKTSTVTPNFFPLFDISYPISFIDESMKKSLTLEHLPANVLKYIILNA